VQAPSNAIDLKFRPRRWQEECFKALRRFSVLVIHRRGGKTLLAVMRCVDAALRCQLPDGRYGYVAPLHRQAKAIAWVYLTRLAALVPGAKVNAAETWVSFPSAAGTHAQVRIFGADNPDAMRGLYFDGIVLDEFAQMKPDTWDEVVLPALSDRRGWALFIGTPKGINRFSQVFEDAARRPGWYRRLLTVFDTDVFDEDEIAELRDNMTERAFEQEFLCSFEAANEDTLIPLSTALLAKGRTLQPGDYRRAAKIVGVDVARMGSDSSVIARRQGLASFPLQVFRGLDSFQLARQVLRVSMEWGADGVLVDGTGGFGAGVIDVLRRSGCNVIDVQFGGRADDPKFLNKRAEMAWRCKEWLEQGGVLPDDMDLIRELCAPTYSFNTAGKLQIESKDDLRERIGMSPDRADALWCTFAHDIVPAGFAQALGIPAATVNNDWDPMAGF
jgi:hypothetical protein